MENKKLHNFGLNRNLFFENRFLFEEAKPAADKPAEGAAKPEEKKLEDKGKAEEALGKGKQLEKGKVEERAKGELDRQKFKKQEGLPDKADKNLDEKSEADDTGNLSTKAFIEKDFKKEVASEIDRVSLNVTRETFKPNEKNWDHTTNDGLAKIKQDCKNLGIIDQDPQYYNKMFAILESATRENNPYWGDNGGAYRPMFKFPSDSERSTIGALEKKGSFEGGEAFLKALDALTYLKGSLLGAQYKAELSTLEKQRKATEDPIGTKVTDFVKSNVATLQKAIRERDYATAGVYAIGLYALWQTAGKKLFGDDHGHGGGGDHGHGGFDFKKWAMIGAAVYGADKLLKNAGYDVLKLTGFKGMDAELRGTPMEAMKHVLSLPQYNDEFKDLDAGIALTMSETKLKTLEEQLNLTNGEHGVHFIDPSKFPGLFPDLRYVDVAKMGIGEQNLGDTTGMSNTKLKPAEREYIRVGQQIYKMARAMHVVYDETIHKKQKKFKDWTYEQALNDNVFGKAKVRYLMEGAAQYTLISANEGIFSTVKRDKIERKLLDSTDKILAKGGFSLGTEIKDGSGHFNGRFKGFPIVVVATNEGYALYLRSDYGPDYNSVPGNINTVISAEGGGQARAAKEFEDKVDARMKVLVAQINRDEGEDKKKDLVEKTIKYENGQWQCKVDIPASKKFGLEAKETTATFVVNADGNGMTMKMEGGVRVNVQENANAQYSIESPLIQKLTSQGGFDALKVFANANLLRIRDEHTDANEFTLLIGKNKLELKVKYDSKKEEFKIVEGRESLLKNPAFAQEYIDALDADEHFELNQNIATLRDLMNKSAPEGFVKHFFTSLFQQTRKSPMSGLGLDSLSGSIPANFTDMVLKTSKAEVMEKLRRSIQSAGRLSGIEKARKEIIQDFNDRIKGISQNLGAENVKLEREGKKWDQDKFMASVVDRVRKASCTSNAYATSKADFEGMVYKLPLPGFLTKKSDLSNTGHEAASDLMGVFVYYTAHLDNPEIGGKKIDLDHLTYPPTPSGVADKAKDPAIAGHLIVRYMDYVKNQIFNKAKALDNLDSIPPATATDVWQVKEFEQWVKDEGDYSTLDPMDSKPKFKHDPDVKHPESATTVEYTELETEIMKEFNDAANFLMEQYPTELNHHAIDNYFKLKAKDAGPEDTVGIFRVYKDPVTGKPTSQLWQWANTVDSAGKRSQQISQIQDLVDKWLIREIFENPKKFFTNPIGFKASVLRRWPWLHDVPGLPNWANPFN